MNPTSLYLADIARYFSDAASSEMSYRTPCQNYLKTIFPESAGYKIQHDQKSVGGNKPDFIIYRGDVPLLYIEVKDPSKASSDLDKIEKSEQATRYYGYTNLILSDYTEWRFYRNGQSYTEPIKLATLNRAQKTLIEHPEVGDRLATTMREFVASQKEPIRSGKHLAKIMGGKAQRIRENLLALLSSDDDRKAELVKMQRFIASHLIANFSDANFADMYAQTLVYGLFAARYNDQTLESFTRQEARDLVPATNPFLKSFFEHISGSSFPKKLEIIVNELCEVFGHADVRMLMEEYFKQLTLDGGEADVPDPVIHFYEDFLREYDAKKKMEMGVFYTPAPVVRFIVRGLDYLLKREFGITRGLADSSKVKVQKKGIGKGGKETTDMVEVHKVQVLDVAVGTGTFLNETVRFIHEQEKHNQGRWNAYVNDDLLPRLHGFELMMASYTIAHLKLAMTLTQSGVTAFKKRLGVYLSNTLDDAHDVGMMDSLFPGIVGSISHESKLASEVKREHPIMVVLGNPPYSGISQNKHYTGNDVYKVEPGGGKLQERKHWLDDDYVKFIRFAESMVEKNGEGVIGMITAHGYIDNPTFRGMRWHLRKTFDAIYVLDLHGNSNKKETSPDGSEDKNVFDIKTGVSIMFGVKKSSDGKAKKELATVYQADLYGKRANKFAVLEESGIDSIVWNTLPAEAEIWKVEGEGRVSYEKGFSVAELFPINTTGIVTMGDSFIIDEDKMTLQNRVEEFLETPINEETLKNKYALGKNYAKWIIDNKTQIENDAQKIVPLAYRPFDMRYTYFDNKLVWRTRTEKLKHLVNKINVGLIASRINRQASLGYFFVSNTLTDFHILDNARDSTSVFPLYLYENDEKIPNLKREIVVAIEAVVGVTTPEDMLDYVYAVLHSPAYREKYSEFLKSDFPRVPYPGEGSGVTKEIFWKLVAQGRYLRELHLLTHSSVRQAITTFPVAGTDTVEKISWRNDRVYINDEQYWEGVSKAVFDFYIGGYQPAQKYLKDRKGRQLTTPEFENYERMIVSLSETIKIIQTIDEIWKPQ